MKNIHIITASAGSGKTYRLSQLLHKKISTGKVRPEAVIATTFTRKAAAELQERVRQQLIAEGFINEANRLAAARMGTINAICGKLVMDFAFEKGLFPDTGILDEGAANRELRRSMSSVLTRELTNQLADLEDRLESFGWADSVDTIIRLARDNGLNVKELEASKKYSIKSIQGLLGPAVSSRRNLESELEIELTAFINKVDTDSDTTKKTRSALEFAESVLNKIRQNRKLKWSEWLKISRLSLAKKSAGLADNLTQLAAEHEGDPNLKNDLKDAISLVFDIAIKTLNVYQHHKRLWGVMDFSDQEALTFDLLNQKYVMDRLKGSVDLLLVDEFQDTSPIQLAILLKLADISQETVWVGDQKQSIFGFRGTDPALMDACIADILKNRPPETLNKSWRSRPNLVHLTSDVFSKAFKKHSIPESWVRLSPAQKKDNSRLGPVAEWWTLNTSNLNNDAMALAEGIRTLLDAKDSCIRDRKNGNVRHVRPGDIAILCRTNSFCQTVATALESINVRAVLPRSGLLDTPEIIAAMAGLRLWVDPNDSLAAAELARIFHFPSKPGKWLESLLKNPGSKAFKDIPEVAAIIEIAKHNLSAGVEQCLNHIFLILNIRERCLNWGDTEERLANLDSLKSHALKYIDACAGEGSGCTPAGLIAHLYAMNEAEEDTRAVIGGEDAVTVITWHKCKGLEWPVTILSQLGKTFEPNQLGVKVVHDWNTFNIQSPLSNRILRYWIFPYHPRTKNTPFNNRMENHHSMAETVRQHDHQELRLLYVGWTRARDRLILAGREREFETGILGMLKDEKAAWLLTAPSGNKVTWAGRQIEIHKRTLDPAEAKQRIVAPGIDYPAIRPVEHPPARISPSSIEGTGDVLKIEKIGERIPISGSPDVVALGEAIHTFYAADRYEFDNKTRSRMAADILERWQVSDFIDPGALIQSADNLKDQVDKEFPGATWQKEVPIIQHLGSGTKVSGFIDLLLETKSKIVIVDHKSFAGGPNDAIKKSGDYFGQLTAYADCLERINSKRIVKILHYPVSGYLALIK